MSRFKRNGHLVRSRVQKDVLLRFVLHWLALTATYFGIVFCIHFFMSDPTETVPSILHQMWQRYSLLVLVMFSLVPYFLYDLIKLTHRFAGPMVRFENALHRAAQGESVKPIKLRKGDYWHEFADDLNAVFARLSRDEERPRAAASEWAKTDGKEIDEPAHVVTI
ncbi:MAG: hypothetical protein WD648_14065 [Planctomycetaceae bacterium]